MSLGAQELDNNIIDLDQASPLSADTYQQLYRDAFDMHTTKSHTPESKFDSELRSLAIDGTINSKTPKTLLLEIKTFLSVIGVCLRRISQIPRPNSRSKSFHDNNFFPLSPRVVGSPRAAERNANGKEDPHYLGPYLLKQTRELLSSGENPKKALELGIRSMKAFETSRFQKPNLEYVMCLHIVAALYCSLGQYGEAIPILERSIEIPSMAGLGIQRQVLGVTDPRFGETCRYVAEAHIQALEFDEAKKLCQMALDIHKANGSTATVEEAADRRLMGLVCDAKGDYEAALEHYVLASITMVCSGQDLM
ncbi:kinesin light chain-related 2-like protein [Tanacetum coccineum]|uniref:Kinesin light chain-related 2-like protein n=1 Tax=Tanacetum coccineum TaxID=301880 RepID=A0ABQ4XDX9_9ASTR